MSRRRKGQPPALPPRSVKLPVAAVFNPRVSDSAFRLLAVITSCSFETGWCDLNNKQLADVLGVSRQYVSRLISELSALGLIDETDLGSEHRITPAVVSCHLDSRALFEPAPAAPGETPAANQAGGEAGLDQSFARLAALWVRYFDDIKPVEADLLGDFLDDPDLAALAQKHQETAETWIASAIDETALAKARVPIKYMRTILNNWIQSGSRKPQKGTNNASSSTSNTTNTGPGRTEPAGSPDRNDAIAAILDRLESGQLEPDDARTQLAAHGHIL